MDSGQRVVRGVKRVSKEEDEKAETARFASGETEEF